MKPRRDLETPWITSEGTLDLVRFPIDSILKQTLSPDFDQFRSGCMLLRSMAHGGRAEAGVYLVGLMHYYRHDLRRLDIIAEQLAYFHHVSSADALLAELRRVKSSNTTRRYLDRVVRSLIHFPGELVRAGLVELACDTSFSMKMRSKFSDALECIDTF